MRLNLSWPHVNMSAHSRGNSVPAGFYSKSTPNLPTLGSFAPHENDKHRLASPPRSATRPEASPLSPVFNSALSETASVEDNQDEDEDQDQESFVVEESESEGSEEEQEGLAPTSRPLYTSRSYTHLPRHATALFPPFYNRPPNPLPPSPSFTSLLRPAFSRPASGPTTPESSDVEAQFRAGLQTNGTSTPSGSTTNLVNSARNAPTVPRASPKVPTYEYYGFALYLGSSAAFLMYILWAYVPAPMLHQMGIHYYPNRWWALAVPCWLVVLVVYIYVALASYNTQYLTLPLSSCENLVDECAQIAVVDPITGQIVRDPILVTDKLHEQDKEKGTRASAPPSRKSSFSAYQFSASRDVEWEGFWSTGTDAVMDVPIGGVCEILYGSED
jgi:phosphatidylinositol glycan class P protein